MLAADLEWAVLEAAGRAELLKLEGNAQLGRGEHALAFETYTSGLLTAPPLVSIWLRLPGLVKVRMALLANRALAGLRCGWPVAAIADCSSLISDLSRLSCQQSAEWSDTLEHWRCSLMQVERHVIAG